MAVDGLSARSGGARIQISVHRGSDAAHSGTPADRFYLSSTTTHPGVHGVRSSTRVQSCPKTGGSLYYDSPVSSATADSRQGMNTLLPDAADATTPIPRSHAMQTHVHSLTLSCQGLSAEGGGGTVTKQWYNLVALRMHPLCLTSLSVSHQAWRSDGAPRERC